MYKPWSALSAENDDNRYLNWMNEFLYKSHLQTALLNSLNIKYNLSLYSESSKPWAYNKIFLYHAYILFSYKKKKSFAIKESRTDNIMNICQIEIKQHAPPSQNMLFIHCSTLPPPTRTSNDARTTVPTDIRHSFKPTFFLHRMRFCSKLSFIFLFPILWHIFKWNC